MSAPGLRPGSLSARMLARLTLSGQPLAALIRQADPHGDHYDHSWNGAIYKLVARGMATRPPTLHGPVLFALTALGEATLEALWAAQEAAQRAADQAARQEAA